MNSPGVSIATHLGDSAGLWDRWLEGGDVGVRNELLEYYLPWSRKVASSLFAKYRTPGVEWEDFVNFCAVGLLDAIDRFDPTVGVPFEGYAYKFLKGSVLRGSRCFMEEKGVSASHRGNTVSARLPGVDPTADSFDVIVDAVVGLAFGCFLESGIVDTDASKSSMSEQYNRDRKFGKIADSIEKLDESLQFVIRAHYFHHMKFVEIADILQVSRARVSQLHHRGLQLIRQYYEEENP